MSVSETRQLAVSREWVPALRAVAACTSVLLSMAWTPESGTRRRVLYRCGDALVECVRVGDDYRLCTTPSAREALSDVLEQWSTGHCCDAAGPGLKIPEGVVQEARKRAKEEGVEATLSVLLPLSPSAEVAQAVADALCEPLCNGVVVALRKIDGVHWYSEAIGMLKAPPGLWLLTSAYEGDKAYVRFSPTNGLALKKELEALLSRTLG